MSSRLPAQTVFLIDKTLGKLDISGDEKAAILGLILRVYIRCKLIFSTCDAEDEVKIGQLI